MRSGETRLDLVTTGAESAPLLAALERLGAQVTELRVPLDLADAEAARRLRREIADQLDDYVLPRLRRLDAPLLAVVGGPTGAGKSTLVNSLVGTRVSAAGVLRPTTRSAVLAHHPADARWFDERNVLPGLERSTDSSSDPASLQLVRSEHIPAGLALLDAPDIDSVVSANRELATQLLAAADMWIFVTTAARYADAVPWDFLRAAVTRGTAVAVVLDRVPEGATDRGARRPRHHADRAGPRRCAAVRGAGDHAVRRDAAARGDRAVARVAARPGDRRDGARERRAAHPRRRDPVAGRAGVPPRRVR